MITRPCHLDGGSGRLPVSACICRRGSYSGITNTTKSGAPGIRGTSAAGGAAVYGELQHAVVTVGFGAVPASGAAGRHTGRKPMKLRMQTRWRILAAGAVTC